MLTTPKLLIGSTLDQR